MRVIAIVVLTLGLSACSGSQQAANQAALEASAEAKIGSIPAANPHVYAGARESKAWRNPYLVVRPDGIGLVDLPNHEIHILKPEEVTQALAKLPASDWPYGRVVAVEELGGSQEDKVRIRANKGLVVATLKQLGVGIEWVPAS